jgi:ribosomal protein L24
MKLLPDLTPWEVLEIYTNNNTMYCLQFRANKKTGTKYFRTSKIVETEAPVSFKNITIEQINQLTEVQEKSSAKELKKETA